MKWLIGLGVLGALVGAAFWYLLLDASAPARAEGEFDLAAYRALLADDAPETLPREVRIEFVGASDVPSFAAQAGDFSGNRTFAYVSFQIVAPDGTTIIDAAADRDTLNQMSDGAGQFDEAAYTSVLDAEARAARVMITHEHLDHVMAIARHPEPESIAPQLQLTRAQLDGLPEHAQGGVLAPAIANREPIDLSAPRRLAPGIVAAAAPGHSPGTIVLFVRSVAREYLFIGDIAWVMDSIENLRGRPRLIPLVMPGVILAGLSCCASCARCTISPRRSLTSSSCQRTTMPICVPCSRTVRSWRNSLKLRRMDARLPPRASNSAAHNSSSRRPTYRE